LLKKGNVMETLPDAIRIKQEELQRIISRIETLGVAFSGGVDSSLLLAVARTVLGDRVVALTAASPVHARHELDQALALARRLDVRHVIVRPDVMADANFRSNGHERCYYCKKCLFKTMQKEARTIGIETLAHGANADDILDYRPGRKAAEELGVAAPLSEAGFTKTDIRQLARSIGLPNWNRPAMACLATRLPYGTPIEAAVLRKVEAAEAAIRALGITQCRVRYHQDIARIEVGGDQMEQMLDSGHRQQIVEVLLGLGFYHVCLDLEGYVSGKMNRGLQLPDV
jgi:uncharacterized protein